MKKGIPMSFQVVIENLELIETEVSKAVTTALYRMGKDAEKLDWFAGNGSHEYMKAPQKKSEAA